MCCIALRELFSRFFEAAIDKAQQLRLHEVNYNTCWISSSSRNFELKHLLKILSMLHQPIQVTILFLCFHPLFLFQVPSSLHNVPSNKHTTQHIKLKAERYFHCSYLDSNSRKSPESDWLQLSNLHRTLQSHECNLTVTDWSYNQLIRRSLVAYQGEVSSLRSRARATVAYERKQQTSNTRSLYFRRGPSKPHATITNGKETRRESNSKRTCIFNESGVRFTYHSVTPSNRKTSWLTAFWTVYSNIVVKGKGSFDKESESRLIASNSGLSHAERWDTISQSLASTWCN